MAAKYKAKCDKCNYLAELFDPPLLSYEMPDGATVTIESSFVWCAPCQEVRWGEELAELAQLEQELAAIMAKEPSVIKELSFFVEKHWTLDELLAREKRDLESRIAWRRLRKSAPRCLECGSMDITPLVL